MVKINAKKYWYTYVLLCFNRTLLSGVTTDIKAIEANLYNNERLHKTLKAKDPIALIKKYRYLSQTTAQEKANMINQLKGEKRKHFILEGYSVMLG